MFFSHGTCHSKGVLVLVRDNLDLNLQTVKIDSEGRYIMLDAIIQDSRYCLLNIYAPNKCSEQIQFFQNISEEIKTLTAECDSPTIVGGDFNVILDEVLDGRGGNQKRKESAKYVEEFCVEHDLIDIWHIRNPSEARFTWRQKTPIIQRWLDYWLVSDCLQIDIDTVDITTAIKSDHSAITLGMNGLDESLRGPSFWKFNSNLVNDPENVSSCVLNNGFSTGPFSLGRGVRQGDPLSPYLFIIALEVLAIRIRNDNTIQGFKFGEENLKLNLFADDMTCFLSDKGSYITLFRLLKDFGECSGLKVNHEKTEALVFGDSSLWEDVSNMYTLRNVIKSLGVYFGGNGKERDDLNYRETLKSIKKSLNLWKWRGLSLLGRIQIVKTFAIPKLMFRASAIPISRELLKNADSIFYSFIWNGKDKVKRNVLTATIENGGLNMLDIDSMVHTKRVLCLIKEIFRRLS